MTIEEKPSYLGHRQRLKERFLKAPQALPDYELLEVFLGFLYPRKDMKPLAKNLLTQHHSLWGVFFKSELASHVAVVCFHEIFRRLLLKQIQQAPVLNNIDKVIEYAYLTMGHLSQEQFRVFFLNKKYYLIHEEIVQKGTLDEVPLYPRTLMAKCLEFNAANIILVHNHPSGDPSPSKADVDLTKALEKALAPFQIRILDHIIIGKYDAFSFREEGYMQETPPVQKKAAESESP
jgi:DNA repair protein RadC